MTILDKDLYKCNYTHERRPTRRPVNDTVFVEQLYSTPPLVLEIALKNRKIIG